MPVAAWPGAKKLLRWVGGRSLVGAARSCLITPGVALGAGIMFGALFSDPSSGGAV